MYKRVIDLTHNVTIKQTPYCASPTNLQAVMEHVNDRMEKGIPESSASSHAAPVVLVPEKQDPERLCYDYKKINSIIHMDTYPFPNTEEIFEFLSGAVLFITVYLNSGYWQVKMDKQSQDKNAFICPFSLYRFKVMLFGLQHAPTFQWLLEFILGDLWGKISFVHLDDLIVYSPSLEQHMLDTQAVLNKLHEVNLMVNMNKCQFLVHVVTFAGVEVNAKKTKEVQDFPVPQNIKELQWSLELAGWYHHCVPRFSQLTEPLNALTCKGAKFIWTPQCQAAFKTLKQHLYFPPILSHADFNPLFMMYTDASDVGLGAVLDQQTRLGTEQVLGFANYILNQPEIIYFTTEQECIPTVWTREKWQYYSRGRHIIVVTDHFSLFWVFKTQKPSARSIQWALRLQELSFTVKYCKGQYNTVPVTLSGVPMENLQPLTCAVVLHSKKNTSKHRPISAEDIWKTQQEDADVQRLCDRIMEMRAITENPTTKSTVVEEKVHRVILLPHKTLRQIYHDSPLSGLLGRYKTYKELQELVYWPTMSLDVRNCVQCCRVCQLYSLEPWKPLAKLQQTLVSSHWEILGPFTRGASGILHVTVFLEYYTCWIKLFSLHKPTAETVSHIPTRELLTSWGMAAYILSDQGPQLISSVSEETCRRWTLQNRTSPHHSQTNLNERINCSINHTILWCTEEKHKTRSTNTSITPRSLKLSLFNIRSSANKTFIISFKLEFMLITETLLDDTELIETSPTNYNFEYCSLPNKRGGGISVCNYLSFAFDSYLSFECLSLVINSISPLVLLLTVYYPPGLRRGFLEEINELFSKTTTKFDCIIISGNFSIHTDGSRHSDIKYFISLLDCFDFKQHVSRPKHGNDHRLSLIFSRRLDVTITDVLNVAVSDHCCIFAEVYYLSIRTNINQLINKRHATVSTTFIHEFLKCILPVLS